MSGSEIPGLYAVILAGGSGTRLWPYSRPDRPKQLLPLVGERSLLEISADRLRGIVAPERVLVITARAYVDQVRACLPELEEAQILGEPAPMGTAAAIGLGMAVIQARHAGEATNAPPAHMLVVTADHLIEPVAEFRSAVRKAVALADRDHLVTFGVRPSYAETGYGYVELGEAITEDGAADSSSDQIVQGDSEAILGYRVARFEEKPDLATAQAYLASGRHVWNSGMFAWRIDAIDAAFQALLPRLAERMAAIAEAAGDSASFDAQLEALWSGIEDRTTIDYGIMEQAERVACVPASFDWRDLGSWTAVKEALPEDAAGNAVVGRHLGIDTQGCLIFSKSQRPVATIGLENMVVVDTPDALLICPADRAQEVKAIVEAMRRESEGA